MRTIILATDWNPNYSNICPQTPTGLLNILGTPILEHTIANLADQGCKEFEILLFHHPERIENHLGSGNRFGVQLNYHLVQNLSSPFKTILPALHRWTDDRFLFGSAENFLLLPVEELKKDKLETSLLFYDPKKKWTGWGVLKKEDILKIQPDFLISDLEKLLSDLHSKREIINEFFSVETPELLLQSNIRALKAPHKLKHTSFHQQERSQAILISRGTVIHPTAELKPPVFIGEYAHIDENAVIGPSAIVDGHTIIDHDTHITRSFIAPKSYLGPNLNIEDCMIHQDNLYHLKYASSIALSDPHLLSKVPDSVLKELGLSLLSKILALIFLIFLCPLLLLPKTKPSPMLKLPTSPNPKTWKTTSLSLPNPFQPMTFPNKISHIVPLLWPIFKGDIHFTGLPIRTPEEVEELPEDHKNIVLNCKSGIFTLPWLELPENATYEEQHISEAYYTANRSLLFDLHLLYKGLLKLFFGK